MTHWLLYPLAAIAVIALLTWRPALPSWPPDAFTLPDRTPEHEAREREREHVRRNVAAVMKRYPT